MSALVPESQLQQDLQSGGREATYRAMSFIARRGGPALAGPADSLAALGPQRERMLAWLQLQADMSALAAGYERYCATWSPVWKD